MRISLWMVAGLAVAPAAAGAAQDASGLPPGWEYVVEGGIPDTSVQFVSMPPGWHFTTTSAGLWWDSTWARPGNFTVEMETYLFPESSSSAFGVFVSGRDLRTDWPWYVSFEVSGEGTYTVSHREGSDIPMVPARPHRAVQRRRRDNPVKNVLRLEVRSRRLEFFVNDVNVARVDRATVRDGGLVGMRIGGGLSLHVTRFDVKEDREE
jgi:hypothetical protein